MKSWSQLDHQASNTSSFWPSLMAYLSYVARDAAGRFVPDEDVRRIAIFHPLVKNCWQFYGMASLIFSRASGQTLLLPFAQRCGEILNVSGLVIAIYHFVEKITKTVASCRFFLKENWCCFTYSIPRRFGPSCAIRC